MIYCCGQGTYCPRGSSSPLPCPALTVCAAGSSFPAFNTAGLVIMCVALLVYAAAYCGTVQFLRHQKRLRQPYESLQTQVRPCPNSPCCRNDLLQSLCTQNFPLSACLQRWALRHCTLCLSFAGGGE